MTRRSHVPSDLKRGQGGGRNPGIGDYTSGPLNTASVLQCSASDPDPGFSSDSDPNPDLSVLCELTQKVPTKMYTNYLINRIQNFHNKLSLLNILAYNKFFLKIS